MVRLKRQPPIAYRTVGLKPLSPDPNEDPEPPDPNDIWRFTFLVFILSLIVYFGVHTPHLLP